MFKKDDRVRWECEHYNFGLEINWVGKIIVAGEVVSAVRFDDYPYETPRQIHSIPNEELSVLTPISEEYV